MGRLVDVDDLADAHEVASILGLGQANSVYTYQKRYETFPEPVINLGGQRPRLWLKSEIHGWMESRGLTT